MLELSQNGIDDDFVYVSADVNGLKYVNDTFGHLAGDELLSGATLCMKNGFGPYGSVYRVGGDEFAALINADEKTFADIMKNVHSIMDNWKGQSVDKLSVSIGYASHREFPDMTIEELNKTADKLMYVAKAEYYKSHDRRRN
ncbi:MAG: GGDEF domain-containing protein [Lachnospiraceae bacterium]|nr:GGDEF domain-containing protein [Lachnospiraceae bacterium]